MKSYLFFLIATLFTCIGFESSAQLSYDPNVIILVPNSVEADKSTKKEIDKLNKLISEHFAKNSVSDEEINKSILGRPANVGIMRKNTAEFNKHVEFYSSISSVSEQFLQYKFFSLFPDLLILAKHEKSDGSLASLKSISEKFDTQFILNFKKVKTYKSGSSKILEVEVQLFDVTSNSIILEKKYKGDQHNTGYEFTCDEGTLGCSSNNAVQAFIFDVIKLIAENSPALKRKKQLESDRLAALTNEHYPKAPNKSILDKIDANDATINPQSFYHGFMNSDNTMFIGFFAENSTGKSIKDFENKYGDNNVSIISEDPFGSSTNTYCFVVYGVLYEGKWYYEKDKITHFTADNFEQGKLDYFMNLGEWDFFAEDSDQPSAEFWETNFFAKVKDLTKDPDWEKYGESMWKTDEINNRPYIGMYEIVVERLKEEQEAKDAEFESSIVEEYIKPYINKVKIENKYEDVSLNQMSRDYVVIYSHDKRTILCPYNIEKGGKVTMINYLVLLKTETGYQVYKWNYLKPENFASSSSSPNFKDQLNTLTHWNFSLSTIDDINFWASYVLVKDDKGFKYLEK